MGHNIELITPPLFLQRRFLLADARQYATGRAFEVLKANLWRGNSTLFCPANCNYAKACIGYQVKCATTYHFKMPCGLSPEEDKTVMKPKARQRKVGVLMLDTQFPRLIGDIGNPDSFEFEVIYETVRGASPEMVVREQSETLLAPFIHGASNLVEQGAELVTTSCGFLYIFQSDLAAAVDVPVITSSLMLLPELEAKFGRSHVGILTISRSSMSSPFKLKADIREDVPIASPEGGREFSNAILCNKPYFDEEKCRNEVVDAALRLVDEHRTLNAILLECTNLPPYADDIVKATRLPVYSLNTMLENWITAQATSDY